MNKLTAFRTAKSTGLFEQDNSKDRLVKMGNPMENITRIFDFETFRATLEGLLFTKERKSNAGRRPIDCVMMFKVLFLQRYYGLSDEQTEYQIVDRGSFRRFVGIENVDDVPDARTIWKYREELTKANAYDKLFDEFTEMLRQKGYELNKGQMIDASFVVAPRQRNTREENQKIKEGNGDELWNDTPHKKSHKDIDARWTKKRGETFYGYKSHTKVDERHKFALTCLIYNISRYEQILRRQPHFIG